MKKIRNKVLLVSIVLTSLISFSFVDVYFEASKNLDIFATLFRELNIYYVDETNPGDLMKKGIDAMLKSLDPYTSYIPESDIEEYKMATTGQYGGIGAMITRKDDYIMISDPYEGFAADKAGLKAGDLIVQVDDTPIKSKNSEAVSSMLKGQAGTEVKVLVKRYGIEEPFELTIKREDIRIGSVPYSGVLDGDVGYIKLSSFTSAASDDIVKAFEKLKKEDKIKYVILDLRGNPGGLLREAIDVCNIFIEKGKEILKTKSKIKEWDKTYKALNNPVDTDVPLVVLINRGSASASEIVAGTVQDLDRGVVIGQRSFGKGLVQTTRSLSYNSQLKVTTAKYYTPSGRCIQALDYSNRNDDGSVGRIADSLITEFKTEGGRSVFDGGGIAPDIDVEVQKYSNVFKSIFSHQLIFDFATQFYYEHEDDKIDFNFKLSDADYAKFVTYLDDKKYDYESESLDLIEELEELAKRDKMYDSVKTQFESIRKSLIRDKSDDLKVNQDEISDFINQEIVARFQYQKGRIRTSLTADPEIDVAISILKDNEKYKELLTFNKEREESKKGADRGAIMPPSASH
ncbi:MAG: S41 family peptidase [Flavobacteriales bacterium]|nr:S41 family peptidase [Flavobacteriales bacterium]